jgi:hypothetical protein
MKTSELTGADLALWVARAQGICLHDAPHSKSCGNWGTDYTCTACGKDPTDGPTLTSWRPHESWAQGGPLLDECKMHVAPPVPDYDGDGWTADLLSKHHGRYISISGATALQAICRAYVACHFGDTVPDEVA